MKHAYSRGRVILTLVNDFIILNELKDLEIDDLTLNTFSNPIISLNIKPLNPQTLKP